MCFTQTLGDIKSQDMKAWSSQRVRRLSGGRIPTLGDGRGYLWKHPCPRHALSPPLPAPAQQRLRWGIWGLCPAPERLTWGICGACPLPTPQSLCPTSLRLQGDPPAAPARPYLGADGIFQVGQDEWVWGWPDHGLLQESLCKERGS